MSGWLYLIKNGGLYKIGITNNFENRMRQLKPDYVVSKLYSVEFKKLEREFHKRYKKVRIPQTEYFRLDEKQINEIIHRISRFHFSKKIIFYMFIKIALVLFLVFSLIFLFISLYINDIKNVLYISLLYMEKISFLLSFIYLFIKSNKYLSFINEFKFRTLRAAFFLLFALAFKLSPASL